MSATLWTIFAIIVAIYCFLGWRLYCAMGERAPGPQTDESIIQQVNREVADREKVA